MATNVLVLAMALWSAAASMTIARAEGPIALGAEPARVWVKPVGDEKSLAAHLERLGPDRQVFLVLNGLSAETQPRTAFAIYLDSDPNGTRGVRESESPRVGRITFYEEIREGRTDAPTTFRSFDVTARLQELRASGRLTDALAVTIVPERKTAAAAKATVANIELVAR
jgi:hypothetical protein